MNKIKLFCLPYAGGSSIVFNRWKQLLHEGIELRAIELAGRGRRMQEQLYTNLPAAVADVLRIITGEIIQGPYALFGHSMGSKIVYELARTIRDQQLPAPQHLFFSGASAPHVIRKNEKKFHLMDDRSFRQEVIGLGGTPPELFEHPELMDLFLPVLKNDFKIAETDWCHGAVQPIAENITVFLGKEDDLTPDQCDGWKCHSSQCCTMHHFEGGHFFLHGEAGKVVKIINDTLCPVASTTSYSAFRKL